MISSSSMIFWALWFCVVLMSFALYEAYCIRHNKMTLSRTVWTVSQKFPAFPAIVMFFVGFLTCHFWWEGGYCAPATPVLSMLFGG